MDRNKVRRRTYSAMRSIIPHLRVGLYLIIAKTGVEEVKGRDLENELRALVVSCLLAPPSSGGVNRL